MEFKSIGTSKVRIGLNHKMGSTSLGAIAKCKNTIIEMEDDHKFDSNVTYVVLIRDVLEKWFSGYQEEFCIITRTGGSIRSEKSPFKNSKIYHELIHWDICGCNDDWIYTRGFEVLGELHDPNTSFGIDWMWEGHARFWQWNMSVRDSPLFTLQELTKYDNIWFLEMKDLSNPKFLKWLQEKDDDWKIINYIPQLHKGKTWFHQVMNRFWKEYNKGKILKDKKIVYVPDIKNSDLVPKEIIEKFRIEQIEVNKIRNNHPRYIKV